MKTINFLYILFCIQALTGGLYAQTYQSPLNIGTKNTSFTYSNTQNTVNLSNSYGRSTNEAVYVFTLNTSMEVIMRNCNSSVSDTYMYLLDALKNLIVSNDDYSGAGCCSNTYHSYIKRQLPAGTYYLVCEGYSSNGNITTNITGTSNVPVLYVSLNIWSAFLTDINQTIQLSAMIVPSDATNKNVTWSSSNTSIATVSNTGLVTAKAEGQAFVTVTTQEGGYSATATINVTVPSHTTLVDIGAKTENFTYTDNKHG